ncbi:hypothetical protein N0V86_004368 [Didymella sp. IMI 355093]|nr:hypothetical protein N0V86_004368 [Didymella sp. IMI 355093]
MTPPHTAKTPGSTAAQTNSRRNARRQAIEEVDEDPHADESMSIEEEVEDDGVEPSQGTAVQNMIMGSLNNQKKRHDVKKKQVKEEYSRTKTQVQDNITTLFEEHEEQAAQLKRLADLIALKAALESQMTTKLAHLQAMHDTHSQELSEVIETRIKALKK